MFQEGCALGEDKQQQFPSPSSGFALASALVCRVTLVEPSKAAELQNSRAGLCSPALTHTSARSSQTSSMANQGLVQCVCPGAIGAVQRGKEGRWRAIFSGILRDPPVSFLCMVKIDVMRTEAFLSLHGLSAVSCLNDGQTDRRSWVCKSFFHLSEVFFAV